MNQAAPPRISVIIPCYNHGAYIGEAIESVLAQTVTDFEILVVDDGSTDANTRRLLAAPPWPQAQVFRTDNGGVGRARNFLIERARGTFLCALDADDKLHPEYFERTVAAFERDPSLTFVSTHMQMFGDEDRQWPLDARCDLPALLTDDPVFCAALVKRSAVVAIGGYDTAMPAQGNEDWDLWIRLLEEGARGTILPDVLFYYRRLSGSMCDHCTTGETHLALMEYLFRKHWASYATHADYVERWQKSRLDEARRVNDRLADDVRFLTRRVAQLQGGSPEQQELQALRVENARARAEIDALRSSASWRLAAPFRRFYDWLQLPRFRSR